jgi:hypothetical protein
MLMVQDGKLPNGTAARASKADRIDSKAAAAEAEMIQSAGDVGEWLGVDSGAPAPVQVTLVLGVPFLGAPCFVLPFFLPGPPYVECLQSYFAASCRLRAAGCMCAVAVISCSA